MPLHRTLRTALCALTLPLAAVASAHAQPLSLGDQYSLRAYTGQAMGSALTGVLQARTLGIATNASSICASLSAAIGSQFVAQNRGEGALTTAALARPEDARAAVASFASKDAVALVFGGQTPAEENFALVRATLAELARTNHRGAVFFHVRVWAPQLAVRAAAEDPAIASYLANKPNLHTVTINPQTGRMHVHRVQVRDGQQGSVEVLHEVAMNDAWLTLFRRSI